jgi:hypothetical protein
MFQHPPTSFITNMLAATSKWTHIAACNKPGLCTKEAIVLCAVSRPIASAYARPRLLEPDDLIRVQIGDMRPLDRKTTGEWKRGR